MAQIKKISKKGTSKAKQKKLIKVPKIYRCADCDGKFSKRFTHRNANNLLICSKCNTKYRDCADCGNRKLKRDICTIEVEGENRSVCSYCKGHYYVCQDCDDGYFHHRRYMHAVEGSGRRICDQCYEDNYEPCDNCGEAWLTDNLYYEDQRYCPRCYETSRRNRLIKNYSYRPPYWKFLDLNNKRKQRRNTTYAGIELEVECDESLEIAEKMESVFKDHTLFKEDGSINGFEIVTHPQTLAYMKQKFNWKKKLKKLADVGCKSYDGGKCGIHITVNKSALSEFQWWKFSMFFDVCKTPIMKFSKRTSGQVSQWCSFPKAGIGADEDTRYRMRNKGRQRSYREKYSAINFKDNGSVEIRIFRGTLAYDRFWASVLFVYALMDFVRVHGYGYMYKRRIPKILWNDFAKWVETKPVYDMFTAYLESEKKKLTKKERKKRKLEKVRSRTRINNGGTASTDTIF